MSSLLDVVVSHVRAIARDVLQVDLQARAGESLPGAQAGAHIDLHLPQGLVRSYSLVNATDGAPLAHWRIAVGWDAHSRGGSHWIHEKLRVDQTLQAGAPRNHFAMDPAHRRVLLLAGGIGITPLHAMAQHCAADGVDWQLLACARSASRHAYAEELRALGGERVESWCDDERGGPPDLTSRLAEQRWDAIYACGPAPLLDAVGRATAHWRPGSVRMERFQAVQADVAAPQSFELVLARSALATEVASAESVLDALQRLGVDHPYSCREGLCGSCEAPVLEGEVDHRDSVLGAAEKAANRCLMVCVSRCSGPRLVLDL